MSDDDDELEALLAPADIWGESVRNVVKTIENRRRWRRRRAPSGAAAAGGDSVSAPLMRHAARAGRVETPVNELVEKESRRVAAWRGSSRRPGGGLPASQSQPALLTRL